MHALVTGASGFIGRHLVSRLQRTCDVTVLLRPDEPDPPWTEGCDVVRADLGDPDGLPRRLPADVILHLAALSDPVKCEHDPVAAARINVQGTQELLRRSSGKFVLASTMQVYARSKQPLDEAAPVGPSNVYGATKLLAERVAQVACGAAGRPLSILRLSNVYGPYQSPELVVGRILDAVAARRDIVVRSLVPERDFVFVEDVVDAMLVAVGRSEADGTLNIAHGTSVSIGAVADAARAASPHRPAIIEEDPGGAPDRVSMDPSRAGQVLGWQAKHSLQEGIQASIDRMTRAPGN